MHFDLTDLRLFLHVAEAGSITAGAARSGLALASASARVQGVVDGTRVSLTIGERTLTGRAKGDAIAGPGWRAERIGG